MAVQPVCVTPGRKPNRQVFSAQNVVFFFVFDGLQDLRLLSTFSLTFLRLEKKRNLLTLYKHGNHLSCVLSGCTLDELSITLKKKSILNVLSDVVQELFKTTTFQLLDNIQITWNKLPEYPQHFWLMII